MRLRANSVSIRVHALVKLSLTMGWGPISRSFFFASLCRTKTSFWNFLSIQRINHLVLLLPEWPCRTQHFAIYGIGGRSLTVLVNQPPRGRRMCPPGREGVGCVIPGEWCWVVWPIIPPRVGGGQLDRHAFEGCCVLKLILTCNGVFEVLLLDRKAWTF